MNLVIREIRREDIGDIVAVHMEAFPDFFLTFLGASFLKEFYRSFIHDDSGVGYVAVGDGGHIQGVVVGPMNPQGYFKRLLKRRFWAFCLASAGALLKKPSVAKRLFRAVFYRGGSPPGPTRALLSSIAVSPTAQGRGIGKALMLRWMQEAKARGAGGCFLTTDALNNEAVNVLYRKLGWTIESTYVTPKGREMNRYVYDFVRL